MKTKLLIRMAAGCMLFFALGHSVGHVSRKSITDTKAQEVIQVMTEFKFNQFGQMRSYDENYTGMSLNLLVTLLMLTLVLWFLSNLAERNPKSTKQMLIPIALCLFAFAYTGFTYFFPVPAITCLFAGSAITLSILKLTRQEKIS